MFYPVKKHAVFRNMDSLLRIGIRVIDGQIAGRKNKLDAKQKAILPSIVGQNHSFLCYPKHPQASRIA
jgi:hypothetical protein